MKATGIVRRIDDLGRVVIPKEIRRTLRIRDGDPLEIYTEKDGEVIFKKYSPMGELGDYAASMCETLGRAAGVPVAISDRDAVIAVSGVPKRELRLNLAGSALSVSEKDDAAHELTLREYRRGHGHGILLRRVAQPYAALALFAGVNLPQLHNALEVGAERL